MDWILPAVLGEDSHEKKVFPIEDLYDLLYLVNCVNLFG
jgi:hypothetical protein